MNKRNTGWLIVALLIGGLCAVIFSAKTPRQTFREPNGSLVTLVAVTYGSNQVVVLGSPIQRVLHGILPAKFKKLAKVSVHKFSDNWTNLTPNFWFVQDRRSDYLKVRPVDEFGCEVDIGSFAMSQESVYFRREDYQDERVFRYLFRGLPPAGRIIGLVIYDSKEKTNKIATIMAPDAAFKKTPLNKQSAAAGVQIGEMNFKLKELVTGLRSVPFGWVFIVTNGGLFTEAVFHVTKDGHQVRDWLPSAIEIKDAKGVQLQTWNRRQSHGFKNGDPVWNLQGTLDPALGPWTWKVTFSHEATNQVVEFEATPVVASTGGMSKN